MTTPAPNTLLGKGFASLGSAIEHWQRAHHIPSLHFALLADATGAKPLPPGQPKRLALARVPEAALRALEPLAGEGERTFTVANPVDGVGEAPLRVVGKVEHGVLEFVVGEEELRGFFDGVGVVGEVVFFDVVGEERRRGKKKRRRRARGEDEEGGKTSGEEGGGGGAAAGEVGEG